ncbi:hypothetical protein AB0P19_02325 [Microbacterium oleivorans]|uniref:hypothetical protein n=1 Tax=Microbacterium oleivorans TaxID=273677 RepID=UPI0034134B00
MSNLLTRLQDRKMPHEDVAICLDLNLLDARDDAMRALVRATETEKNEDRRMRSAAVATARKAVEASEAAIRDASFIVRITGVDRARYNTFILECPPRPGIRENFDPTKFYVHVARNTSEYVDEDGNVHPMTSEEWDKIDKTLTDGEHDRVATAVLKVNRTVGANGIDFLGGASVTTPDSSETSESPAPSASPRGASGDGSRKKSAAKRS